MPITDIKKENVITIKLGYKEGSTAPDCVSVDAKCTTVDMIIAREALTGRIHEKIDSPCQFLATAFETYGGKIGADPCDI